MEFGGNKKLVTGSFNYTNKKARVIYPGFFLKDIFENSILAKPVRRRFIEEGSFSCFE